MGSILQITVYLAKIEDFDGMNKVFKTYSRAEGQQERPLRLRIFPAIRWWK
jgi:hypothetical protein